MGEIRQAARTAGPFALLYGAGVAAKVLHDSMTGGIGGILAESTLRHAIAFALFAVPVAGVAVVAYALAAERGIVTPGLLLVGFTALVARGPVEQGGPGIPLVGNLFMVLSTGGAMLAAAVLEYVVRESVARLR